MRLIGGEQAVGILVVKLQRLFQRTAFQQRLSAGGQPAGIVVHGQHFLRDHLSFGEFAHEQLRVQQRAQRLRARIEVWDFFEIRDGGGAVTGVAGDLAAQQQRIQIVGINAVDSPQRLIGRIQCAPLVERVGRSEKDVAGIVFASQLDV